MSAPKTRVQPVQTRLREEILGGRIPPGSKLPLVEIARRLGASVGVVREALIRLCSEGLVSTEPQLGFRVVPVSETDLADLIEARVVVECETFRGAITTGGLDWEGDVIAAYHRLRRVEQEAGAGRNVDVWVASHRHFHQTLLAGCANRRLVAASMALRDAAELYRSSSVTAMTSADAAQRDVEHAKLRDAAVERDAELGVTLLAEHIRMTAHYFQPTVRSAPHGAPGASAGSPTAK